MIAMSYSDIYILAGIVLSMISYWLVCKFVKNSSDRAWTINELKELGDTLKNDPNDGEHFRAIDHYCEKAVDPDESCVVGEKIKVN